MVGRTVQFTATGTYSDGTTAVVTSAATWTAGSETIGSGGAALATGVGGTTVTATVWKRAGLASLQVTKGVTVLSGPSGTSRAAMTSSAESLPGFHAWLFQMEIKKPSSGP